METVKMSECSEEDLDPSDHMTGAGHGRKNIPMRRDSRFYHSVRRRRSNKTGPATEPADNRDCKEDVMNSTSERNSDSSPCWRSPVPQKPALSPLLLGPTSAFKPGIKLNLNGEPTGLIPGGAHAALIQELSGMLQENHLSPRHSEPSRALSDSTVPMEALSQHISCCNIQKGRPPQGKQGEDLNDIDNISVRLLDGESLVGRQAEDQAVTATIGPPAEAWKNLIAQRTGVLYQEYGTQFCLQEIQRRRQCDAESDGEPTVRDPALPLQLCRDSPSSTMKLWQNREAVRSSGVLSVLSTEKRQHQEAMFELVTSETSYYKSLELLVTHFQENHQLIQNLSQSEAHFIFSNIRDVKDVSERFLLDLERRVEENVIISDVCDIVSWHASQHFHEFVTYVSNQTYQQRAYRRILKENESFREVMSGLEQDPQCKGLPFTSFLILPFQRITRLKLLVQNILKKVEEGSEEEASAVMAHKHLEKVVRDCNEGVRKMSRTEELISIEKTLEFKCKSVPVISHSRWLLKRGELQLMSGPKSTRTLRSRKLFQPLYLFLFNNLLLVTRRSSSLEKFYVLDSALRSMLRTEEQQDQGKALSNIFSLCLLENQEERTVNYMLKACSPSDKKRWISALTPNPRTKFLSAKTHQSDSPQVQCVHLYVSQEPDELSLDLADVLNVVEQTEDGWILGERLHDREKGWFPCKVVEEIHNQELRAQNLRECHRIYRAQESRPRSNHRLGSRARHSRVAPS